MKAILAWAGAAATVFAVGNVANAQECLNGYETLPNQVIISCREPSVFEPGASSAEEPLSTEAMAAPVEEPLYTGSVETPTEEPLRNRRAVGIAHDVRGRPG
jgi:hypothetical protein